MAKRLTEQEKEERELAKREKAEAREHLKQFNKRVLAVTLKYHELINLVLPNSKYPVAIKQMKNYINTYSLEEVENCLNFMEKHRNTERILRAKTLGFFPYIMQDYQAEKLRNKANDFISKNVYNATKTEEKKEVDYYDLYTS